MRGLYIQCCAEWRCKNHTTSMILPEQFDNPNFTLRARSLSLARHAGVQLTIVKHKEMDYDFRYAIDARDAMQDGTYVEVARNWADYGCHLASLQDEHNDRRHRGGARCKVYLHNDGGRRDAREDSTISDVLRVVKGNARNIDIDLCLNCSGCGDPIVAFEFSRDPSKRVNMLKNSTKLPVFRVIHDASKFSPRGGVLWNLYLRNPFDEDESGSEWGSLALRLEEGYGRHRCRVKG